MKSFTGNSLISVLQSGLPEEELERTLFKRFLRAGNLSSARLILERHESRAAGWKTESEALARAYLREAKTVLRYEGYRLAAQHAARARTLLPEKAAQAWHVTAQAERGLKRWPESLSAIEQAIALEPTNAEFWHDKALILEGAKARGAREALAKAIELARQADAKDPRLENWSQHLEQLGQ
jgi:tetratricopeptide (TPR) repeat protein